APKNVSWLANILTTFGSWKPQLWISAKRSRSTGDSVSVGTSGIRDMGDDYQGVLPRATAKCSVRMLVSEASPIKDRLLLLDDPDAMRRGEPMMSPRGPVEPAGSIEARVGEAPHGHAGEMGEDLQTRDDPHAAGDAKMDFVPS